MIQPPRSIVKNSSTRPKIQLSRAKALNEKSKKSKNQVPIKIKTNKVQSTKEILKPKLPNKISPIIKPISNTISALTLEKDDNTTPSTLTKIFATYYTFVITETSNKIPEPLELHVVKELLSKLFTEKDNIYTSISEYLIAKGKKHNIEIKEITLAEFRKYILKISTIAVKDWINIKPENNMEQLFIKLLKNKR
jgi:hypothetical protein